MAENILTIDAGTTGLKCSLLGCDGKLLAYSFRPYGINYPKDGFAQQPLFDTIKALCLAVREITSRFENPDIAVIGLSGTMNGCIPVDRSGQALYPNIIHTDMRAGCQLEEIRASISDSEYYRLTGNRLDVHYTLPKILWLRDNEPEVYKNTYLYLNVKDAIRGFLTGVYQKTDYSDASLTGLLNINTREWDGSMLDHLGIRKDCMPELAVSHEIGGYLVKEAAEILSLVQGIPVSIGAGDGACATHGAGLYSPSGAYCNIGSSAWLAALSSFPVIDPEMRVFNFIDLDGQLFTACCTVQSGAEAFEWAVRNMTSQASNEPMDFASLESLAKQSRAGAKGLFFLPTLMGERTPWWDPNARGTLIGMNLSHTKADMVRSFYEGVAEALHLCEEVLLQNNVAVSSLILVGGGSQSGIWPQMFADMFHLPVCVHRYPRAATSLGAAIAAGVGVGIFKDYKDAACIITAHDRMIEPDQRQQESYDRHYAIYRTLYGKLKDSYREISRFQAIDDLE